MLAEQRHETHTLAGPAMALVYTEDRNRAWSLFLRCGYLDRGARMLTDSPPVQGLTADQVAALGRLCARFRVQLGVVFGSRSRGDATAASDLDMLVLPPAASPFDILGFEAAAQRIVRRPRVDLTVLHPALTAALAWEALREATVIWEEPPRTYAREMAIWQRRFVDEAPLERMQARQVMQMFQCR